MATDQNLEILISADASGVKTGMADAKKAITDGSTQINNESAKVADSTKGFFDKLTAAFSSFATGSTAAHKQMVAGADEAAKGMATSVNGALSEVKGHIGDLGGAFGRLQGMMVGFTAVLAGGALFADAVSETKKMTSETLMLSKALGITIQEASTLNVALGDIYSDAQSYVGAAQAMTREMRKNEDGMNSLGLRTREADGSYRNQQAIMMDGLKILNEYTEGIDRQIVARQLFGRGFKEALSLLKLNNEVLDEAKKKQEDLGLTISQDNVNALKAYKAAMNDAGDVVSAIKKVIGDEMMPILTQLAEMFAETGPQRVAIMREAMSLIGDTIRIVINIFIELKDIVSRVFTSIVNAITGGTGKGISAMELFHNVITVVKIAFLGFELVVVTAAEVIGTAIEGLVSWWKTLAKVAYAALTLDFAGAKAAFTEGINELANIVERGAKRIAAKGIEIKEQIENAALNGSIVGPGSAAESKPPKKLKSAKDVETEDEAKKRKDKNRMSEWEAILADQKVQYQKEHDLREMDLKDIEKYWQSRLTSEKLTNEESVSLKKKISEVQLAILKKDAATKKALTEEEIAAEKELRLDAVTYQEQQMQALVDLDRLTKKQQLDSQRLFEEERFTIELQALQKRLAMKDPQLDPVEYKKLLDQIEALKRQHELKMAKIALDTANDAKKTEVSVFQTMQSSFQSAMDSMLSRSTTFAGAIKGVFRGIFTTFMQEMVTKPLAELAARYIRETAMYKAMTAANALTQKAKAVTEVISESAVAGAGGVASMAAAPFPLNMTAPAFGAAMAASAMAFAPQASFAQGAWNLPQDMVATVHKGETIMPRQFSEEFRDNVRSGGGGGTPFVLKGVSAGDFFIANKRDFLKFAEKMNRNFEVKKR